MLFPDQTYECFCWKCCAQLNILTFPCRALCPAHLGATGPRISAAMRVAHGHRLLSEPDGCHQPQRRAQHLVSFPLLHFPSCLLLLYEMPHVSLPDFLATQLFWQRACWDRGGHSLGAADARLLPGHPHLCDCLMAKPAVSMS